MTRIILFRLVLAFSMFMVTGVALSASQPNVVVILTDDQGYADISLNPHHSNEVSTPNMDALAKEGISFTQAYTSGHVCSPTRAGLMIGGYSQRVGIYTAGDGGKGFDPKKRIFPAFLPEKYHSTAIGKWHLGLDDDYPQLKWHAMSRGFDEAYKFMGRGGHSYFDLRSDTKGKFSHPLYRNKKRINDEGYLTTRLSEEAVAFIDRNKKQPFFLYLAYNAVHSPAEAPQADIDFYQQKFPGLSQRRAILMAMLKHLDDGIGDVIGKLKKEGLFNNTLLIFLTDNGGAKNMEADNAPLNGFKGSLLEGGIRTPFIVSWPNKYKGGQTIDTPIISFDILPTVLDALDINEPEEAAFDGKSILPLIEGTTEPHHETLFWSKGSQGEWAVRRGDWKRYFKLGKKQLFHLGNDPAESTDVSRQNPLIAKQLDETYGAWIAQMAEPITSNSKQWVGKTIKKDNKKKDNKNNLKKRERSKEIKGKKL